MEQSDQTQKRLIPATPSFLQVQDNERQAVLAFIEYLRAFQEAGGKDDTVHFHEGDYHLLQNDLYQAIHALTKLLNETLRKKTTSHPGGNHLMIKDINCLVLSIASYLGFYNYNGPKNLDRERGRNKIY